MFDAAALKGSPPLATPVWALAIAAAIGAALTVVFVPWGHFGDLAVFGIGGLVAVVATWHRPRLLLAVGAAAYVGGFAWIYVDRIVPVYGYSGLIDSRPDALSLGAVALLAAAPAAWLPLAVRRPSDVVVWFLYLFGYVSAAVVPIYVLGPDLGRVAPFEIALALGFSVVGLIQLAPRATLRWPGLAEPTFVSLIGVLGVGSLVYIVAFFGVPTGLPDFVTAYDVRADFGASASTVPFAGYLVTWSGNVIYPFLIAVGLTRSKVSFVALGLVGEVLIYAVGGFKFALFGMLLVALLCGAIGRRPGNFGTLLMWGAVSLLGVSVAATAVTGSLWPLALGAVRLLALPGQLTSYYFDFFSTHPAYELSHSVLRGIIPSLYDIDPPYLIGAVYLHVHVDANANFWADAMANFGLLGIVPFSVIVGGVLWTLDSVSSGRDLVVIGSIAGIAGLSLASGALFTSILTFGIGLTIVLAALMPRAGPLAQSASPMPAAP